MTLLECEPKFLKILEPNKRYQQIDSIDEAQGLQFLCPVCLTNNKMSPIGVHSVLTWFANCQVPESERPETRRPVSGTSYNDLTLQGSILFPSPEGCKGHFSISNGIIIFH